MPGRLGRGGESASSGQRPTPPVLARTGQPSGSPRPARFDLLGAAPTGHLAYRDLRPCGGVAEGRHVPSRAATGPLPGHDHAV